MRVVFLLVGMFYFIPSFADGKMSNVDLVWKAKGLQALETLEKLIKKNGDSKGKKLTDEDHCEWQLANAYASFVDSTLSDIVRKKAGPGMTVYWMVLTSDGTMHAQIGYLYSDKSASLVGFRIGKLENGSASAIILAAAPQMVGVQANGCNYIFPMSDPFGVISQGK